MFSVWFENADGTECCFISGIPTEGLAERIRLSLIVEDFVTVAWVEQ